ncbi:AEC family transporter [Marinobacterium sp. YM272]|uniref:AEC family transporter n=1 Tax=Marinobacterium sp. YM272 TaxID=3421654 RepID=UPI003D7FB8B8
MDGILTALWPVFALLVIGYLARRLDFPGAAFWPPAEKATYFVLFPCLLVNRLSRADLASVQSSQLVAAVLSMLLILSLLVLLVRPLMRIDNAKFTSVYQGSLRFNTYVALAVSAVLLPQQGIVLAAVLAAVMIPTLNLLCVLVFAWFGESRPTLRGILRTLSRNPLILACLLGIALNLTGIGMPAPVAPVLDLLGRMALPLGLLAVGAALNLRALTSSGPAVVAASLFKLIVCPLLAVGLAALFALSPAATLVLLIFASVPTATTAYILARQLGGDAELMANIITTQTLLSLLTMPLVLLILV